MSIMNRLLLYDLILILMGTVVVLGQVIFDEDNEEKSSYGGRLPLEEDYYYGDGISDDIDLMMGPLDHLISCKDDRCPQGNFHKLRQASGQFPGRQKLLHDYKNQPYSCRCDVENCTKYGDCCVGLILNGTQKDKENQRTPLPLHRSNPWKCNFVQNHGYLSVWALMMSDCPESSFRDTETTGLCIGDPNATSRIKNSRKYLLDLPVFSKKKKIFYRNIYCARCHNEHVEDILDYKLRLTCNKEFTPEERSYFQSNATYNSSERAWTFGNVSCQLNVDEFSSEKLEMSVPGIRYCGSETIDSCAVNGNVTERMRALCSSYTQYVTVSDRRIFKNPHCYTCNKNSWTPLKNPTCFIFPFHRGIPPGRHQTVDGAGLIFLFDFNLLNENQYVGYDTLCHESEVWDYIRQKCHPMICGKDHVLKNGVCEATGENTSQDRAERSEHENDHDHEPKEDLKLEPECFRILIHEDEHMIMKDKNNTAVLKLSTGGYLPLSENEYEIWNETTISICAKDLHRAFQSRFSPIFNYLSVGLMGLSVGFLFLHLLLYVLLPKIRNLPSKNLFCLTLSLFLSQLLLLIFITATENRIVCITAAITIHYFFLAAFFWMSSMSFDIWRTFSGQSLILHSSKNGGRGSFVKYSFFSWGGSFFIVSLAAITDFGLDDIPFIEHIKPAYGQTGLCWISQRLSLFLFFAFPVALLIFSNLFLFSLTAKAIIIQHQEATRVLSDTKDSAKSTKKGRNNDEVRLVLYVKLALIMGLTWILGFISAFLLWDWLWYAFVVLNGLQGTFIFLAFDFKRRTFGLIQERLGLVRDRKESNTSGEGLSNMTRRGTSTSSTNMAIIHNVNILAEDNPPKTKV